MVPAMRVQRLQFDFGVGGMLGTHTNRRHAFGSLGPNGPGLSCVQGSRSSEAVTPPARVVKARLQAPWPLFFFARLAATDRPVYVEDVGSSK